MVTLRNKQLELEADLSFVDAWPIGRRLDHIMQFLETDEWKVGSNSPNTIKESKMEKLEILIRILKNTTGIETYYPKKKLIRW